MPSGGQLGIWAAGVRIGFSCLAREPMLGIKRILLPVGYWRASEFAYVRGQLSSLPKGARILDLGSPKDLAAMFARDRGFAVTAIDILPEAIELSERRARAMGIAGAGPGKVLSEVRDGRSLPYADGSFDAAFSVSVLEHIPGEGDSAAVRELVRVVKPGGLIVVTVPYDRTYRETFVERPVYEREQHGTEAVFFERHYDAATLQRRLIGPSGAEPVHVETWGEPSISIEKLLSAAGPLRIPLSPLEAGLSRLFLHPVAPDGAVRPMAAFFTLRKPAAV